MASADKTLIYVEMDVDMCGRTYGKGKCEAKLGKTGCEKCFNTRATCQDPENFKRETKTLRFVRDAGYQPIDIDAIPSVTNVSTTPAQIRPGEDLGKRSTVTVSFSDHPHHDRDLDPYWRERLSGEARDDGQGYDPAKAGSYWGKFRARQPYFRNRPLRIIQGVLGQSLDDMVTRHYLMETVTGPTMNGQFTVRAQDVLKMADDDRAQAPVANNGTLAEDLPDKAPEYDSDNDPDVSEDDEGSLSNDPDRKYDAINLQPEGIGDEYPDSGLVRIGHEVISYDERDGDTLRGLRRGQRGTEIKSHDEEDSVQLCLDYRGELASDIARDLLVNYAGVDEDYIDTDAWTDEDTEYINRLFGNLITEPTSVNELLSDLTEQAGFFLWWDDIKRQIVFQALRQPDSTPTLITDADNIVQKQISVKEQDNKRLSQVWVAYGIIDPTEDHDKARNYRSIYVEVDADAESRNQYQRQKIQKIMGRWINQFNRPAAEMLTQRLLSMYRDPPRQVSFTMPWQQNILKTGEVFDLRTQLIQGANGKPVDTRMLVTSYERTLEDIRVEAVEFNYEPEDAITEHRVIITADTYNFNLRDEHDRIYRQIEDDKPIILIVESGVIVGSESTKNPALDIGDWPNDVEIRVRIRGRVQGAGGNGGDGNPPTGEKGHDGGDAIHTSREITIDAENGEIWAGGGGGASGATRGGKAISGGGGGGAGTVPGKGGLGEHRHTRPGQDATPEKGGKGDPAKDGEDGAGGNGGGPGEDGHEGYFGADAEDTVGELKKGGKAGLIAKGYNLIEWVHDGDQRGHTDD